MQSLAFIALMSLATCTWAAILRVPSEYGTIQSALDASALNDTVLVAPGIYAEQLLVENAPVVLKGDVVADTGDYARPVIDPTTLPEPQSRRCMDVMVPLTIEDFAFRNGAAMYPRSNFWSYGGIVCEIGSLTLKHCVFDSVYVGVKSEVSAVLDSCEFRNNQSACVDALHQQLIARHCTFDGTSSGWGTIAGGPETLLEDCYFADDGVSSVIYLPNADNVVLRRCTVSSIPFRSSVPVYVTGPGIRIENCVFTDIAFQAGCVYLQYPCQSPPQIIGCVFQDNYVPTVAFGSPLHPLALTSEDQGECAPAVIEDCAFADGLTELGSLAVFADRSSIIRHSRFERLATSQNAAVWQRHGIGIVSGNIYQETGLAVKNTSDSVMRAEANYWGDPTGPFHPQLNPDGQGDHVGDNIDFDPWYTDTLFFSATPEPHPPLPQTAQLSVYPNPFNASTTLEFTVPRAIIAKIELFDITGRRVRELFHGPTYDTKRIPLNAADLPSGLYFARAWDTLGNRPLAMAKLVLLK